MRVLAPESAVELIQAGGGRLYVWTKRNRCCGGGFSTLGASTKAPSGVEFHQVDASSGFELFVPVRLRALPDELHLEARRFPRRVEAYWNGCAWIA